MCEPVASACQLVPAVCPSFLLASASSIFHTYIHLSLCVLYTLYVTLRCLTKQDTKDIVERVLLYYSRNGNCGTNERTDTNRERVNKGEDDPMRARMNQIVRIWFKSWNAPGVVDGRS